MTCTFWFDENNVRNEKEKTGLLLGGMMLNEAEKGVVLLCVALHREHVEFCRRSDQIDFNIKPIMRKLIRWNKYTLADCAAAHRRRWSTLTSRSRFGPCM